MKFDEDDLKGVNMDKCTDSYTIKIPEILKHHLDNLPSPKKAALKDAVMLIIARHIHENSFDPAKYLSSREA